ncbi:HAD family phosphatase [uncultured Clostridium sp.]|uniref:HAD family hydrolase n=1 Tax=uncultured Clostridium sp. TaxID=59620 RepID=UPI0025FFADC7|nr:HAD family phosphatase [uncultured Clostridium sp.]
MLNNIEAAIFDLDGTLIDSMWVWKQIDIDFLNSKGHTVPKDLKEKISHLSFKEVAVYFKTTFNLDDSIEDILDTWNQMAIEHYSKNVHLKPGVNSFLKFLKNKGIKIGLATSNNNLLLERALKSNNIYDYFDVITTTAETGKTKREPDVYLLCAQKLQVAPNKCIVFEDILDAVQGAKLADMKVIAVNDADSEEQKEELIKIADKYIYDFTELI